MATSVHHLVDPHLKHQPKFSKPFPLKWKKTMIMIFFILTVLLIIYLHLKFTSVFSVNGLINASKKLWKLALYCNRLICLCILLLLCIREFQY